MSKPRPIHTLHRDLRKQPDPAEPSFSYEKESFIAVTLDREEQFADEFHRRLAGNYNNANTNSSSNQRRSDNAVAGGKAFNRSGSSNSGGSASSGTRNQNSKGILTRSFPGLTGGNKGTTSTSTFWRSNSTVSHPVLSEPSTNGSPSFTSVKFGENSKSSPKARSLLASALDDVADNPQNYSGIVDRKIDHSKGRSLSFDSTQSQQEHQVGGAINDNSLTGGLRDSKRKKDIDKQRLEERRRKALEFSSDNLGLNNDDDDDNFENDEKGFPERQNSSAGSAGGMQDERRAQLSSASMDGIPTSVVVPASLTTNVSGSYNSAQSFSSLSATTPLIPPPQSFPGHPGTASLDRSSSDQSTGSLLYCKTPNSTGLFGKSASLIFPTGVDPSNSKGNAQLNVGAVDEDNTEEATKIRRAKIEMALDQCETVRFPFKKKLMLNNLKMRASDIPLQELCGTSLGNSLHKLSLSGNRLGAIPPRLVQNLPVLKSLDLSQCSLNSLPDKWHLPKLTRLNLSNNRFTDFPDEGMLEGLPELQELNMYGNIVKVITIPSNPKLLSKLEILNLGYNDLVFLPPELDRLKSLRVLKLMNNFLAKVPMRICEMDLKTIDVSSNPITEPPIETCERGICAMRRHWQCIRNEEQAKTKAVRHQKQLVETRQQLHHQQQKDQIQVNEDTSSVTGSISTMNSAVGAGKYRRFINPMKKISKTPSIPSGGSNNLNRHKSVSSASSGSSSVENTSQAGANNNNNAGKSPSNTAKDFSGTSSTIPESIHTRPGEQPEHRQTSLSSHSSASPFGPSPISPSKSLLLHKSDLSVAASAEGDEAMDEFPPPPLMSTYPQKAELFYEKSDEIVYSTDSIAQEDEKHDQVTVNDTLKVIFVGMAMVGKTSMIKRLIEGQDAVIPTDDERTVGVDIYEWEPRLDKRFEHIDSRIQFQDEELAEACGDINVKFSVWDFAGQHVYHATHELFFSNRALYVLVWDMGATNVDTLRRKRVRGETGENGENGTFKLSYESSDEEDESEVDLDDAIAAESEARRADRALERDIDDKVQFWVDCIQSSAPGAAILPVASFSDYFDQRMGGETEAIRRCNMLKQRLLRHEERRIQGIEQRLQVFNEQNRADDPAAIRLRKLLNSYTRPRLIFGNDDSNSVVRVSGLMYTGFANLTENIINIATGRNKGQWKYPIFHGHVGARIPRMRLDVRDAVREMRDRFKVVEWGYFVNRLRDEGLTSVEDISDALHFLTNTGELSYFGSVMQGEGRRQSDNPVNGDGSKENNSDSYDANSPSEEKLADNSDDDDDDEQAVLSMDDTSTTAPSTMDGSQGTIDGINSAGLSQFVFLNPRWLVAAVACILRHDLDREIKETRRIVTAGGDRALPRTASFFDAQLNCPVITADDACMLWSTKRITKKAAERAEEYSNNMTMTPFEFLQRLLIRFGVFVPIDLSIEKASFGGKDYQLVMDETPGSLAEEDTVQDFNPTEISVLDPSTFSKTSKAEYFFLPSLLGPCEPSETWTYKSTDSWKTTLCHSVLFPDGVPPGLMERLTASVLSSIYAIANRPEASSDLSARVSGIEGRLYIKEVLCWRAAFYLKIGAEVPGVDGSRTESIVEIFTMLANRESHLCVGSDYMEVGARRLILSGRGQEGDGGRKIWKGGYLLVIRSINRVMAQYGGLEYENQGFCPECLAKVPISKASAWDMTKVRESVLNGERTLRCKHHGHPIDTRLVAGPIDLLQKRRNLPVYNSNTDVPRSSDPAGVAVKDIQQAIVVVGLWDGRERKVTRVGSGFIVDKKRGLIVTAAHTLINIWGDPKYAYGENYYGLSQGKVVVGVIPDGENTQCAVFRYFAKIVMKCPNLDRGECQVDACVLRITTRMEVDVDGDGSSCGDVPEILLLNNPRALKNERLQSLKMTDKCELDEQVRILGYNQGGEGVVKPGEFLNRYMDLSRGYVSKKFVHGENSDVRSRRERFKPREEIVISDCRTIGGHSGGPCVNQQGEVIGILSRADPADNHRCYLVPASELKSLVNQARKTM